MAKKKDRRPTYKNPMPQENIFYNIKKSEETYKIQNRRLVGLNKPPKNSKSTSYLYNEGGMAFDRFEYGLD